MHNYVEDKLQNTNVFTRDAHVDIIGSKYMASLEERKSVVIRVGEQ